MRAAIYTRNGPAADVLSLVELPTPWPSAGEVRVRLAWSGVNPSDVKSRAGRPLVSTRVVPHSDGSGVIDAVGDGVAPHRRGERVWVWNAAWGRPDGTAAEFIVLPAEQAVRIPDAVELDVGACLGIPALTAFHAVAMDGGVAGKSVLVTGGAGAVGHYAVQLARIAGARQVLATVSGPQKAVLAVAAGADGVFNYRTDDVVKACLDATGGRGVDRVIEVDAAANLTTDLALLRPEGDVVIYGSGKPEIAVPFGPSILKNVRLRFFIVYHLTADDRRIAIDALTDLLENGRLVHNIALRLPLEDIVGAHQAVERGTAVGNVVLRVE